MEYAIDTRLSTLKLCSHLYYQAILQYMKYMYLSAAMQAYLNHHAVAK
jgi:hypothetical protein